MRRTVGAAGAVLLASMLFVPVAIAAGPVTSDGQHVLVSVNGGVTVAADESVDTLVVVRGTAKVAGSVGTFVIVSSTADLTGAHATRVIAVNSDVILGAGTVVSGDVVRVGSTVEQDPSAQVLGTVRDVGPEMVAFGFALAAFAFVFFLGVLVAVLAAGLLLAALGAKQVRAAEAIISREPVKALFVGLLGLLLPIFVVVLLFITVIGAPLALGILFLLWPLTAFLGYLVAGIWLGDWILGHTSPGVVRTRPYAASVIGLLLLSVAGLIPFVGLIASLFGLGAVLVLAWRTIRGGPVATAQPVPPAPSPMPG